MEYYRFECKDGTGIYEAVDRHCPSNDVRRFGKPDGAWLDKVGKKFPSAISYWTEEGLKKYISSGLALWHAQVVKSDIVIKRAKISDFLYSDKFQVIASKNSIEPIGDLKSHEFFRSFFDCTLDVRNAFSKLSQFKLGLGDKVTLMPFQEEWARAFLYESARIKYGLKYNELQLFHIGSTSIKGINSKPILDILGIVPDLEKLDQKKESFRTLGYEWIGENGIEGRRFLKLTSNDLGLTFVHLHLFKENSFEVGKHLKFNYHLNLKSDQKQEYDALKKELAVKYSNNRNSYVSEKSKWIEDFLQRIN